MGIAEDATRAFADAAARYAAAGDEFYRQRAAAAAEALAMLCPALQYRPSPDTPLTEAAAKAARAGAKLLAKHDPYSKGAYAASGAADTLDAHLRTMRNSACHAAPRPSIVEGDGWRGMMPAGARLDHYAESTELR